ADPSPGGADRSPPEPLERLAPGAPREVLAIVEKAMARAPGDRYRTAQELSEDLRRFQAGQIILAYRYSRAELALRWLRRHRLLSAGVFASLLAVAFVAWNQVRLAAALAEAGRERDRAERAGAEAEEARSAAVSSRDELTLAAARIALDRDPGSALSLLARL